MSERDYGMSERDYVMSERDYNVMPINQLDSYTHACK